MMDRLESIQYQAALIVSNCWYGTSRERLYAELGWESLAERRTFRRLLHYYKILSDKTPPYLKEHIKPLPLNSTLRYRNSFFPFCQNLWESLSDEIRNATSIGQFKSLYKKAFFPNQKISLLGL